MDPPGAVLALRFIYHISVVGIKLSDDDFTNPAAIASIQAARPSAYPAGVQHVLPVSASAVFCRAASQQHNQYCWPGSNALINMSAVVLEARDTLTAIRGYAVLHESVVTLANVVIPYSCFVNQGALCTVCACTATVQCCHTCYA